MEEFLQPKLDQIQRELGEKMMKAVEAQLTAQFANFAKQLGQMGRPAVPSTPLPVKRTPPPVPPPLQTSRHVKQEDSHVKKLMFGNPQSPPILQLIQEKYPKESIMQASNSTIQLKSDNGDMFIARFLDYLKTLGIDKAFRATRIKSIDVTTRK